MFMTSETDCHGVWEVRLSCNMVFLKFGVGLWNLGNSADCALIHSNALLCIFEQLGKIKDIRFA